MPEMPCPTCHRCVWFDEKEATDGQACGYCGGRFWPVDHYATWRVRVVVVEKRLGRETWLALALVVLIALAVGVADVALVASRQFAHPPNWQPPARQASRK